eukprot:1629685-Rhodomonas_salina.2
MCRVEKLRADGGRQHLAGVAEAVLEAGGAVFGGNHDADVIGGAKVRHAGAPGAVEKARGSVVPLPRGAGTRPPQSDPRIAGCSDVQVAADEVPLGLGLEACERAAPSGASGLGFGVVQVRVHAQPALSVGRQVAVAACPTRPVAIVSRRALAPEAAGGVGADRVHLPQGRPRIRHGAAITRSLQCHAMPTPQEDLRHSCELPCCRRPPLGTPEAQDPNLADLSRRQEGSMHALRNKNQNSMNVGRRSVACNGGRAYLALRQERRPCPVQRTWPSRCSHQSPRSRPKHPVSTKKRHTRAVTGRKNSEVRAEPLLPRPPKTSNKLPKIANPSSPRGVGGVPPFTSRGDQIPEERSNVHASSRVLPESATQQNDDDQTGDAFGPKQGLDTRLVKEFGKLTAVASDHKQACVRVSKAHVSRPGTRGHVELVHIIGVRVTAATENVDLTGGGHIATKAVSSHRRKPTGGLQSRPGGRRDVVLVDVVGVSESWGLQAAVMTQPHHHRLGDANSGHPIGITHKTSGRSEPVVP